MAHRKRNRSGQFVKGATKRRARKNPAGNPKRRRSRARGSVTTKRRRSYRRNPPAMNLVNGAIELGRDAVLTVLGRSGARALADINKADGTPVLNPWARVAAQVAVGSGVALFGGRFIPKGIARHLGLGMATVAIEGAAQLLPLPGMVKQYLSSYPDAGYILVDANGVPLNALPAGATGLGSYADPGAGYAGNGYWDQASARQVQVM